MTNLEVDFIGLLNWYMDKYSKLVRDNEKLRISMNQQLDEINSLRGKLSSQEHKLFELTTMLEAERKDKQRVLQTNQDFADKINKLEDKLHDLS